MTCPATEKEIERCAWCGMLINCRVCGSHGTTLGAAVVCLDEEHICETCAEDAGILTAK